jgi:hypothetical protein
MNSFSSLFQRENLGQLILSVLFIIYLILGSKVPTSVAGLIDTVYGKVVVIVIALILFVNSNPVLGILGFIVAYELIRHSSAATGSSALAKYLPTEEKKATAMTAYNQFPYTLEQEMVKKMAPMKPVPESSKGEYTFNPVLDDSHDAAPINYNGVI